jgi:Trichohyalin-plectin-homology domain
VKEMNNMMLYSKVVTIRDKQLLESKRLEQEYLEEQRRLDIMMEIERLKTLKMQEEREAARKMAQKEGCMVIID